MLFATTVYDVESGGAMLEERLRALPYKRALKQAALYRGMDFKNVRTRIIPYEEINRWDKESIEGFFKCERRKFLTKLEK